MDRQAAARAIEQFLTALGHPAEGERAQTPRLVAEAWAEQLLAGYQRDPAEILREASIERETSVEGVGHEHELVILRELDVVTMCPHHLLPAHGRADVVYRPGARLVGFGAVARALGALSRRLTLQESVGRDMARLMVGELGAEGALCRLRMTHTCMVARGERQQSARVETLGMAGSFAAGGDAGRAALAALAARTGGGAG